MTTALTLDETPVTPCAFSKEMLEAMQKLNLVDGTDANKISELTKKAGLRNGKGYKANQIRNFIYRHHTCTVEVLEIITNYFITKKESIDGVKQKHQNFLNDLLVQSQVS